MIYHVLPILAIYGGILAMIGWLLYRYKIKKRRENKSPKESDKVEILWQVNSRKRRRRKK